VATTRKVPDNWWRSACEVVVHPLCCVNDSDHFVWLNHAWEELLGYSRLELCGRTAGTGKRWQDITHPEDLGHDEIDVEAMLAGDIQRFSKSKRFIAKNGDDIPVIIHVNRFPNGFENFVCFIGEAMPAGLTHEDIQHLQDDFDMEQKRVEATLAALAHRLKELEVTTVADKDTTTNQTTISMGNNQTTWIVTIVLALLGVVGYLIYIGGWRHHGGEAVPPTVIEELE
jgi:PAS domain S-box-containing protein